MMAEESIDRIREKIVIVEEKKRKLSFEIATQFNDLIKRINSEANQNIDKFVDMNIENIEVEKEWGKVIKKIDEKFLRIFINICFYYKREIRDSLDFHIETTFFNISEKPVLKNTNIYNYKKDYKRFLFFFKIKPMEIEEAKVRLKNDLSNDFNEKMKYYKEVYSKFTEKYYISSLDKYLNELYKKLN